MKRGLLRIREAIRAGVMPAAVSGALCMYLPSAHAGDAIRIDYYGDSTVQGVDPRDLGRICPVTAPMAAEIYLRQRFPGRDISVVNHGAGGTRSDQYLQAPDAWSTAMATSPAQIVIFNWGINDAFDQKVSPRIFEHNIRQLATTARSHGKIVMIETPNPLVFAAAPFGKIATARKERQIIRAVRRTARQLDLILIDQYDFIRKLPGWTARIPDGAHPDCGFYETKGRFAARRIATVIDAMLSPK